MVGVTALLAVSEAGRARAGQRATPRGKVIVTS
jgi:hypothetical protein